MSFCGKIRLGLGILGERVKARVLPYNRLVSMSASGEIGKYTETTTVFQNRLGQKSRPRTIETRILTPEEATAAGLGELSQDTFALSK